MEESGGGAVEPRPNPNQQLKIRGRVIRVDENGLTCLNDIWSAAGFSRNQRPSEWAALMTTHRRIERVLKLVTGKSGSYEKTDILKVFKTRVGVNGGTWADARLALDYAEYLNPALAIEVKEVFLRFKAADPTLADNIMERSDAAANEWMAKRSISRAARLDYTATLKQHGVREPLHYAECTNATYQELFGKTAKQLKQAKGLKPKEHLRDAMDLKELATVSFAEVMATDRIEDEESRGFIECHQATSKVARAVRNMIDGDKRDRQRRFLS
jgi:hypothetical protein